MKAYRIFLCIPAIILFSASCGSSPSNDTPPKTEVAAAATVEPVKELALTRTYTLEENTEISFACLFCHGFLEYETIREKTADYIYEGAVVQPHVYLDLALGKPHDTEQYMLCLYCHDEHESPEPVNAPRRPTLDYCINCHHEGGKDGIWSCNECH